MIPDLKLRSLFLCVLTFEFRLKMCEDLVIQADIKLLAISRFLAGKNHKEV